MYEIKTNVNKEELTALSVQIYERWAAFATGSEILGGRKLRYPGARWGSMRYAASITMSPLHTEGNRMYYEIYTNEEIAPEGKYIEHGRPEYDLGAKLLASPNAKTGKRGQRYVHVMFTHPENPPTYGLGLPTPNIFGNAAYFQATGITTQGARIHSDHIDTTHTIRTLSSGDYADQEVTMNPFQSAARMNEGVFGGGHWMVPAMHAFAPARTLFELYNEEYGQR